MKQIIINGRVLGVVDVPEYAKDICIEDGVLYYRVWGDLVPNFSHSITKNSSILGRLNDITEEQARKIVGNVILFANSRLIFTLRHYGIEGNPVILLLNDKT